MTCISLSDRKSFPPHQLSYHHDDTRVNPTYSTSVCVHRAVPAQPGFAAAAVFDQEKETDGGNIQAERGREETDRRSRTGETQPASAAAQRRTSHIRDAMDVSHFTS